MTQTTSHGRLVREQCVGVLVDFLTGLLIGIRTIERERFDQNVRGFAGSLKALDIPLCVLGDEGSFRGDFFPLIKQEFADAPHFTRHTPSAWRSGGFRDWVLGQGRRQVVLGGISLDNCTMLTSLDMLAEGLDVHVVVDVSGADSALTEAA
ncbi:MAG: isochorismatase family protein, partial [Methylobacteriaceae bacterium]|nr:isochorismatase family protein [Methylobacteriaceae bacterium]